MWPKPGKSLSFSPPLSETLVCDIFPSEGAASVRRAIDLRLELLKPPDPHAEPWTKQGSAHLGPTCVIENADAEAVEPAGIGAQEPGGALSAVNAAHTPAKSTAGLKLADTAEGAATTKTGALQPTAEGEAGTGMTYQREIHRPRASTRLRRHTRDAACGRAGCMGENRHLRAWRRVA